MPFRFKLDFLALIITYISFIAIYRLVMRGIGINCIEISFHFNYPTSSLKSNEVDITKLTKSIKQLSSEALSTRLETSITFTINSNENRSKSTMPYDFSYLTFQNCHHFEGGYFMFVIVQDLEQLKLVLKCLQTVQTLQNLKVSDPSEAKPRPNAYPTICLILHADSHSGETAAEQLYKSWSIHHNLINSSVYLGTVRIYRRVFYRLKIYEGHRISNLSPTKGVFRVIETFELRIQWDGNLLKVLVELGPRLYYRLVVKVQRRSDLGQVSLLGSVPGNKADTNVDSLRNRVKPRWMQQIYRDLKFAMNFSDDLRVAKGGQLELFKNPDDNLTEADFTAFCQTISSTKPLPGIALMPVMVQSLQAFFLREKEKTSINLMDDHFGGFLWLSFFATWISLGLTLWFIYKLNRFLKTNLFIRDQLFIQNTLIWSISSLSLRSWYIYPTSGSLRIVYLFGGVFSLLFYTFYSSLNISSLTFPANKLKSFQDLISLHYTITVYKGSLPLKTLLEVLVKTSKVKPGFVDSSNQTTHLLNSNPLKDPLAHIAYVDAFFEAGARLNLSQRFMCQTFERIYVSPTPASMIIPKGSPFREVFNYKIITLQASGLVRRNVRNDELLLWDGLCNSRKSTRSDPISFIDLIQIESSFVIGILLSSTFLLCEVAIVKIL